MAAGRRGNVRHEHSSGGAVIALRDGRPFVAMIATRGRTRWGLPKGAVSKGETSEEAALREVHEETGLEARIVRPLDTIEYFFRVADTLIRKRVRPRRRRHVDRDRQRAPVRRIAVRAGRTRRAEAAVHVADQRPLGDRI